MFVWTVQGILDAIMLGIIGLFFLFIGGCCGLVWILETWDKWHKK